MVRRLNVFDASSNAPKEPEDLVYRPSEHNPPGYRGEKQKSDSSFRPPDRCLYPPENLGD